MRHQDISREQARRDLEWCLKSVVDRHPAMRPPQHVFARLRPEARAVYERALKEANRAAYQGSALGRLRAMETKNDDTE